MRTLQKIIRNGDSSVVTIPMQVMRALDWMQGDIVVVECTPKREIIIRQPNLKDVQRKRTPPLELAPEPEMKP